MLMRLNCFWPDRFFENASRVPKRDVLLMDPNVDLFPDSKPKERSLNHAASKALPHLL
jgi:hypothetical protein